MKRSLKSVLWVFSGDAGARLIGFVVTAYLARALGPSSFGLVSIGLAILAYLSQLSGAGLQALETRNVARMGVMVPERVGTIIMYRLVVALALTALTGLMCAILPLETGTAEAIWLSTLILIPLAFSLDWFFQGKEKFGPLGISKVIVAGAYGALAFLFVNGSEDYAAAIIALALGTLAGALLLLMLFRREGGGLKVSLDTSVWRDIAGGSISVSLALLAGQSAVNLGPIVLGFWFGNTEAGIYSAAMKLALVVLLLDRVLNSILLPLLARMHGSRPEEFSEFVKLVFKGVFAVIFPAAIFCGVLAPWLVALIFGEGYGEAVPHLRFLLIYVVLTLLNSVFMCSMLAAGEEFRYSRLLLTGSIILAGLVFLLTVLIGPNGTGLGVGLGELVIFGILLVTTRRILHTDLSMVVVRFVVVAGVTLGTMVLIPFSDPVSLILLSVVVYPLTLLLTGAITVREVRVLVGRIV